jgi:uncharacterized protein (TIGR02996 family)
MNPMHATSTLIIALHHQPNDSLCWLALADALEEEGRDDPAAMLRARLARLTDPNDVDAENRLLVAIRCGVQVPVPQLINSIGMEMALIPPGIFRMGSPAGEPDDIPTRSASSSANRRAFYLGIYPVTQQQFRAIMKHNPSHFRAGGEGAAWSFAVGHGPLAR